MTKLAPHKALKLIASGKLTFDERVVVHRVAWLWDAVSAQKARTPGYDLARMSGQGRDCFQCISKKWFQFRFKRVPSIVLSGGRVPGTACT